MMLEYHWGGLVLPLLYLVTLNASVYSIYSLYQRHKEGKLTGLAPWFPPHLQRDIYLSLLHIEPPAGGKTPPIVPKSLLRAALLRRAVQDIHRLTKVRSRKQACASLLEQRSVGDDLWQQLLRAEKEMELELRDVVSEANALTPNWGQTIFQTANDMVENTQLRTDLEHIQAKVEDEKEWLAKRRVAIEQELLQDVGAESKSRETANVGAARSRRKRR